MRVIESSPGDLRDPRREVIAELSSLRLVRHAQYDQYLRAGWCPVRPAGGGAMPLLAQLAI